MKLLHRFVRWCPGAVGFVLRQKYYPKILGSCGKRVIFGRFLNLQSPEYIHIADNAIISNFVTINVADVLSKESEIHIDRSVFLGAHCRLQAKKGGKIRIREGANISSCCTLQSESSLDIGQNTLLAAYCNIGLQNADQNDTDKRKLGYTKIGEACWLGVRVQQYAETNIGKESIVGAHAFIHKDVPAFSIAVGRPAKVQRMREAISRD